MSERPDPRDPPGPPDGGGHDAFTSGQVLSQLGAELERAADHKEPLATPEPARYRAGALLGVGGMGQVVAAHDARLGRDVALKRPNAGQAGGDLDARLAREAWITARLDHPGIVPIYDAGLGPDGRIYYTMPIVRGRSLADALRVAPRASPRLLRRVLEACEAVGAAHRQGVVHRDLKPANIMLGDGGGTRVLDWGLARLTSEPPSTGVVGTPQYMSPEQARGAPTDARADVWSLGAILFEVCAGHPLRAPGQASEVLARARAEADDPAAPELADGLTGSPASPGLQARLAPDLVALVRRALAPRPEARYRDATALAEDLGNHLDGRRVLAHDYSARELLVRFLAAWRVPLIVAAAALAVVTVLVVIGVSRLGDEAERAAAAASQARAAEGQASAARDAARADLARSLVSQATLRRDKGARPEAELLAAHALTHHESPAARGVLATWSAAPAPRLVASVPLPSCLGVHVDRAGTTLLCREAAAISAWELAADRMTLRWRLPRTVTQAVVDDGLVVTLTNTNELDAYDASTSAARGSWTTACERNLGIHDGRIVTWSQGCYQVIEPLALGPIHRYPCEGRGLMGAFAVEPSGDRWVGVCEDGHLVAGSLAIDATGVIGVDRAEPVGRAGHATSLHGARLALALGHLEGGRLVAGTADGSIVTLDSETGVELGAIASGFVKVISLSVSGSGRLVAARAASGSVALVDPLAGLVRARLPDRAARFVAFVGEDPIVADHALRRYELARGAPQAFEVGSGITSLAFDPRGDLLAATSGYHLEARAMRDGALVTRQAPRAGFAKSGTFAVDGGSYHVVTTQRTTGPTSEVEAWDAATWAPAPTTTIFRHARRVVAMADGSLLIAPYQGGVVALTPGDGARRLALEDELQRFADLGAAPGGRFAAGLAERDGRLVRIALPGPTSETIGHDARARAIAIAVDGALVATAGEGGVRLHDADRQAPLDGVALEGAIFDEVAISDDVRWLAAGSRDGVARLWSLPDLRLVATFDAHHERVSALAFAPGSRVLASGSWDGWVRLYDIDRIEAEPAALVRELEATWGLGLAEVLGR